MRTIPLSAALLLWAVTVNAQTAKHASATQPAWGPAPAAFPAGAQMAVISGDPSKAAPFTVEPITSTPTRSTSDVTTRAGASGRRRR